MTTETATRCDAYRVVVEERIRELWRYRQWWRENRWADWPVVRHETDTELRALVRLARAARRLVEADVVDHPADATVETEYATWTNGALVAGFGK